MAEVLIPVPDSWPRFGCDKCGKTFVVHPDMPLELPQQVHVDGCGLMAELMAKPLLEVAL